MKFTKMQGLGNDYIYINGFKEDIKNPAELSIRLSERHFGVGSDGIIIILPSDVADFRMRMFNADGSEGRMCGNGARCVAKYCHDKKLTDKTTFTLETLGGIKTLSCFLENGVTKTVSVDMGRAEFRAAEIPVLLDCDEVISKPLSTPVGEYTVTCVSMGNPHCVIFTECSPSELELDRIGPHFENHEAFPERVNTEFIRQLDESTLEMRVWERGSGETLACGTGACAAVAAAVRNGLCQKNHEICVRLLGGELYITCSEDYSITMRGPAEFSYEGEIEL